MNAQDELELLRTLEEMKGDTSELKEKVEIQRRAINLLEGRIQKLEGGKKEDIGGISLIGGSGR